MFTHKARNFPWILALINNNLVWLFWHSLVICKYVAIFTQKYVYTQMHAYVTTEYSDSFSDYCIIKWQKTFLGHLNHIFINSFISTVSRDLSLPILIHVLIFQMTLVTKSVEKLLKSNFIMYRNRLHSRWTKLGNLWTLKYSAWT